MKRAFLINLLTIYTLTNTYGQISYKVILKGDCSDSIGSFEFNLYDFKNDKMHFSDSGEILLPDSGFYSLGVYIGDDDYVKQFSIPITIYDYKIRIDTVIVPKILFVTEKVLHSEYWDYYYCEKLCNGIEKDYHPNGNISIKGDFLKGKPYWIEEYRDDGVIETRFDYKLGMFQHERITYYDEDGKLEEYEVYKYRKKRGIEVTYNSVGIKTFRKIMTMRKIVEVEYDSKGKKVNKKITKLNR